MASTKTSNQKYFGSLEFPNQGKVDSDLEFNVPAPTAEIESSVERLADQLDPPHLATSIGDARRRCRSRRLAPLRA